ncbi:MAG TPA: response regulator [bacterium]|nr:response regulator [bacterium]
MGVRFRLLIGDRNGHVRDFLKRELTAEGYDVRLAGDGREVLAAVNGPDPPDLLIMDLLLPFVDGLFILEKLRERQCPVPVIIYTALTEYQSDPLVKTAAAFIEKDGEISSLKNALADLLLKFYPGRCQAFPSLSRPAKA